MQRSHLKNASLSAMALMLTSATPAFGQDPRSAADSALLTYHPPRIALFQPGEGAALQQDKAVVVIRFAAGDPGDPVDLRSFAISVDAKDETDLFQVAATEAWGPIASRPSELSVGNHEVATRICSARGACASKTANVTVAKPMVVDETQPKVVTKKRRVIDALLSALRSLLKE
jgi:hypothetical protein